MTDDEDSLPAYGGAKLLSQQEESPGVPKRRSNHRQFSHELIEPGINNEGLLTESDSELDGHRGRNRGLDGNSSDEGLVTPKKVSLHTLLACFWSIMFMYCDIFVSEAEKRIGTNVLWPTPMVRLDCVQREAPNHTTWSNHTGSVHDQQT